MPSVPIVTHPEVAAPTEDGGTSAPDTSEHPALLTRVPSLQQLTGSLEYPIMINKTIINLYTCTRAVS